MNFDHDIYCASRRTSISIDGGPPPAQSCDCGRDRLVSEIADKVVQRFAQRLDTAINQLVAAMRVPVEHKTMTSIPRDNYSARISSRHY